MAKITLSDVEEGKKVKLDSVDCKRCLSRRIAELGICNGYPIEIIKNDNRGPVIIKILDSKLMIGRGQAKKMAVSFL